MGVAIGGDRPAATSFYLSPTFLAPLFCTQGSHARFCMKCSLIFPGRIPSPLFVPLCLQPHSSLSCYPVYAACLSTSTAIIMQLTSAEDPLRARHCSRGVTLMNSFQPQTTHFTDEEAEAYRIKSIGPKSYSWEVGWSASECSQLTPVPLSVPMASQGCLVLACWRAQQMLQKWANLWMGLSACPLTKRVVLRSKSKWV